MSYIFAFSLLKDPKYTLMILMPNHQDGLSELLLLLPTISLRYIHNSLKPTAVHATIPTFKYTAKVDLTSALQQVIDRSKIVKKKKTKNLLNTII